MKKLLLAFFVLLATVPAYAKQNTTTLKFAKGSYCTSFDGYYHNRVFNIYLLKGQALEITIDDVVDGVVVKDSKGKRLQEVGLENFNYDIKTTGNHTIKINRASINGGSSSIKFCAY